jgi:hypothetical protein
MNRVIPDRENSVSRLPYPHAPWYREPWPWILMAGPAAAVVAGFITLYIAAAGSDPLVADNYYKDGLAINRMLERDRNAARHGYRAVVLLGTDGSRVRIHLSGQGQLPERVQLRFSHPTRASADRDVSARRIQPGWYEGEMDLQPAARWDVQLEDAERHWRLRGSWSPARDETVVLTPSESRSDAR